MFKMPAALACGQCPGAGAGAGAGIEAAGAVAGGGTAGMAEVSVVVAAGALVSAFDGMVILSPT